MFWKEVTGAVLPALPCVSEAAASSFPSPDREMGEAAVAGASSPEQGKARAPIPLGRPGSLTDAELRRVLGKVRSIH